MNNKLLKWNGTCYQHQDHAVISLQQKHLDHRDSSQRTNTNAPTCSHELTKNCVRQIQRDYGHELFLDILDNITTKLTWQQHFYAPRMCFCDRDDRLAAGCWLAVFNISLKKRSLKSDIKQLWAKLFLHCPGYNNILCFHRRLQFSVLYFLEKIKLKPSVTQDVV